MKLSLKSSLVGLAALGFMSSVASADTLPPNVADQLTQIIESSGGQLNPAIYTLAGQNPTYADQIACISVMYFGNPGAIEEGMLGAVSGPNEQAAISDAVRACSQRDVAGGYGKAAERFLSSIAPNNLNTLSLTVDSVSPIAP